eukprot:GDKH01024363.1.p1 GENE.GDKH01024363.1~~GDKH01024363.1.p1  ORF type:complete len:199 (+),score=35.10 GDKH01024363.1:155-751(+)
MGFGIMGLISYGTATLGSGALLLSLAGRSLPFAEESINSIATLAWGTMFGTKLWVSFVAGIIMMRNLPRHAFGRVQSNLFPAYFNVLATAGGVLALATPTQTPMLRHSAQVALFGVLLNLLILSPWTTKLMFRRHQIEKRYGLGEKLEDDAEAKKKSKDDPELRKLNKSFGMAHGLSMLANLISFVALIPFALRVRLS